MIVLYRITCSVNGKAYIGITSQNPAKRWKTHRQYKYHHRTALSNAIAKYGVSAFSFEVIASVIGSRVLAEQEMIRQERTIVPGGYNLTGGGEGMDNPSQETRAKLSAAHLGRKRKPFSEAHRIALSAAAKRRRLSAETRKKMSDIRRGKKPSKKLIASRREGQKLFYSTLQGKAVLRQGALAGWRTRRRRSNITQLPLF